MAVFHTDVNESWFGQRSKSRKQGFLDENAVVLSLRLHLFASAPGIFDEMKEFEQDDSNLVLMIDLACA